VPASPVSLRLPRHFSSIVTADQRAEMQKVQAGYQEKISELRKKLDELEAAQLKELEGLLTAAQRKTLDEMRSSAGKTAKAESQP
jgi:signal transduction histidine kinase